MKLYLWHGFNKVLLLSFITLIGGIGFYFMSFYIKKHIHIFNKIAEFGPEAIYNLGLKGLITLASKQTNFFQSGSLRTYFYYILTFFVGLVALSIIKYKLFDWFAIDVSDVRFYELLIVIIMIMSAFLSIISRTVLGAVAALGMVGFGVALLFAFLSAPDLALTQFSIETLTVILLVLVAYKVPQFKDFTSRTGKFKDIIISLLSGTALTLLVLMVLNNPADSKISDFFLENSYLLAHGKNVVNVILVDFRALDTMGEITVLALAAIGVYTLLEFRLRIKK
ncbi:MAG: DUF4040 domain-containing protein [Bacteroidales bacterium]|nr:DUF4040 domain-containing protein [Bacteroidales bacterium]